MAQLARALHVSTSTYAVLTKLLLFKLLLAAFDLLFSPHSINGGGTLKLLFDFIEPPLRSKLLSRWLPTDDSIMSTCEKSCSA